LNKSTTNVGNNFWLTTGQFRVGNPTEFMYWNGTNLYLTGNINATGGKFTGNVQLAIPTGGTTSGTLYAGANPTSGARVRLSSEGIFAYDSTSTSSTTGLTFSLQQSNGQIDARAGTVGGWTLATTGLSSTNTKIESNGTITLGDTTGTLGSIVRLSATDDFRIWIGSQSSSNAPFKVSSSGVLTATGATITGNVQITSGSTYDSIVAVQNAATAASNAAGTASADATSALSTANGKNSIFRTGSTPIALKIGDIWINSNDANKLYVAEAAGTNNWVLSRDTAIAAAVTKADDAFAKATEAVNTANNAYPASNFSKSAILQAINASTNGATLNGGVLEAGTVLADNVVSTYVYAGYINADMINAGTLSGRAITGGSINIDGGTGAVSNDADGNPTSVISTTSNAFSTLYSRNGINTVGFNAIGFISVNSGGWNSSCYPYYDGGQDLGVKAGATYSTYRWRNLRLTGSVVIGGDGSSDTPSTSISNRPVTRIFGDGRIFANTLGTSSLTPASGRTIVQDGGYLNVYVAASSQKYKDNIESIDSESIYSALKLLRPVTFNYKPEFSRHPEEKNWGLIAEEVHSVLPNDELVVYKDGEPDSVKYEILPIYMLAAIKEMANKIDVLQSRLDALEA
jgi:hypothetical protein